MTNNNTKKIVILGAGVAGIHVVQGLQKRLSPFEAQIILIDENDYHQYLYRIHEVCNVNYNERDIIVPLSKLISQQVNFFKASVQNIDTKNKTIKTDKNEVKYDICVIALGSHVNYFNIQGLKENSKILNSFESAKEIREIIHEIFEKAKITGKPPEIIIGGGGFTGVELAGELCDSMPVLYKRNKLQSSDIGVTIVEALPSILQGWDKKQILYAKKFLEDKGVNIILNDPILRVNMNNVELKSGKILKSDLLIWTGGVRGDPACGIDFQVKGRRINIDDYCRAIGFDDIYVAGDSACAIDENGSPMPPTAHIAMVQGDIVMHNIISILRNLPMEKYTYKRAGEIITLGKTNAIMDLYGFKFSGFIAKILKKVVHLWYLYSIGGLNLILSS